MQRATRRLVGGKVLEVPNIFASYRIGDYPRAGLRCHPWSLTNTQAVLLNAFDVIGSRRTKVDAQKVRQCAGGLHGYVEMDGPLMLDSGAFNFLRYPEISITPEQVLGVGLELGADVLVALDHPFPPNAAADDIRARWNNTCSNTRRMVETLAASQAERPEGFQLMPVLHGHDADTLKRALDDIVGIIKREPTIVGIGSLAPLALNGNKRIAIDAILTVRGLLPKAHIHCFSLGSALLMLLAFYCGADTVDSQTWIMSAAFKQAQLPGCHLTRLSAQEARRDPAKYKRIRSAFADQLLRLAREEGFVPKNWDTGKDWPIVDGQDAMAYLDYLEEPDGVNHIHRRACHNLHAFNFEAACVRAHAHSGDHVLQAFIETRIKSTVYRRALEYAVNRSNSP